MKLGTENRNKTIAAVVLMVLAAALIVFRLPPSSGAPASTVAATHEASRPSPAPPPLRATGKGRKKKASVESLDPTLRVDWLKASEDTEYAGTGRNIFSTEAPIPQPVANGTTDKQAKVEPPTPPTAPPPPPINLKFFGFASKPGEPKKIFLSQGEDVFIAAEGDIVDRRYKILHIAPMSVEIEDVLNNNRQNIPLTQG